MTKINLSSFIEYTKNNLIPKDIHQEQTGRGKTLWTSDDWTLAVANCLDVSIENYKDDIVEKLNYYRDIIVAAERKYKMFDLLEKKKNSAESILVGEVGRGLDIIFAFLTKEWKTVYCYDQFEYYEKFIKGFFPSCNIKYTTSISKRYDLSILEEPVIFMMNMSKMEKQDFERFKENDNIISIINDGVLIHETVEEF
jgi:hypothetical protein